MADDKTKVWLNVTKIVLILLGAAGLGGYSYTNHKESARGYEALATAVNQSVLGRLDTMERRLDLLEQKAVAPASQPIAIKTLILPGPSKDPYGDLRRDVTALQRAQAAVLTKVPAKPAPKAQMRVPSRLKDVP